MKKLLAVALLCVCLLGLTAFQTADRQHFVRARLTGYGENKPISTVATGELTAQISADESTITYTLTYRNIEGGTALFSHIHFGQWWTNGGVIAFLCGGGGKPDCPSPSGTATGTIVASDIIGPADQGIEAGEFAEALRAIRSGATYANVHSTTYPGGEIRGQIKPRLTLLFGR